jgi:hypothetical protein
MARKDTTTTLQHFLMALQATARFAPAKGIRERTR